MDAGREGHEDEEKRASRRTMHQYAVAEGERRFNVRIAAPHLGLTGVVDEVVYATNGEVIPVDYKLTRTVSPNHRLQLTAYALLLETTSAVTVQRGFIYLILARKAVEVSVTDRLRAQLFKTLTAMRDTVSRELMPVGTSNRNSCFACEFRRFCNDV
jgi:CRISPR-associated exonuclease Cas4